ncbi:HTH-type transcriptional repressor AllR [compost metagenome]
MHRPASYATRAQHAVKQLAEATNETSGYYERAGDEAEAMRAESAKHPLVYSLTTGDKAPLYCISAGKVLLAHLEPDEIHDYLTRTNTKKFTANTLNTAREILKELKKVRETGFGYSYEEYFLGIIGIATAVRINGKVVGALSVALPTVRHNSEMDGRIRRALVQAATEIERNS